jgi:dipeptidase E
MRMFLASLLADTVDLLIKKCHVNKLRVLFIANPADPFKNKYWVNKDRKAFLSKGFQVEDIDLREVSSAEFKKILKRFDILHICGGSAIYILKLLKDKKMLKVIKNALENNQIIYTGTSAGSMIMAPNISFCSDDEDEQEAGMVGKLKDFNAIGLSPFYIMCHAQEKDYIPSTKRNMDKLPRNKLPILFLNDNMALWFEGKKIELLQN